MAETVNQEITTETPETKTFTQTELDHIVGERLAREREKYSDYEALKEKASRLDNIEESQKSELQKATERASAAEAELAALKKAAALREMKEKVAAETGVPANLLTGESEDECKKVAEAIKAYANPNYPTVEDRGEVHVAQNAHEASAKRQFAAWLNQT